MKTAIHYRIGYIQSSLTLFRVLPKKMQKKHQFKQLGIMNYFESSGKAIFDRGQRA
jgi:hypothetical protein